MFRDTIISTLISFTAGIILCPAFIPVLHKLKFGQYIREEGPQSHQKKSGTPTMGGIVIILSVLAGCFLYFRKYTLIIPVVLFMFAFGLIGLADDFIKVVMKHNEGLKVWQKLCLQLIVTGLFIIYLYRNPAISKSILIPFTGGISNGLLWKPGILFIPIVLFAVLGTDNGVNFTDGLDGLCTSVTVIVALFFTYFAITEDIPIAPVGGSVVGALLAFLVFNSHPAKVFMGDTGSLALGGFVSSFALITGLPLFIIIVGFVYLCEVLSVILQVGYFKLTHGKRIFKMAPIHHHFELSGWSETKIVTLFTIVTVVLSLFAVLGLG